MQNAMTTNDGARESRGIDFLHEIGGRIATADPLDAVLARVVEFISTVVNCDSCFVYLLEGNELVLKASKNPHAKEINRLSLPMGQGITGWVAAHKKPVALARNASTDPRFRSFNELPEDRYEAFLSVPVLSRVKLVGVINLQHREPHQHTEEQIQLISTIGFLVGAEVEMARLESENSRLSVELESRKVIERAKGILQKNLQIDEAEAYLTLQKYSRQRRKSMKEIAEAVILGEELKRTQA
jgi:signal transduction protein with GAF and PtsI domain